MKKLIPSLLIAAFTAFFTVPAEAASTERLDGSAYDLNITWIKVSTAEKHFPYVFISRQTVTSLEDPELFINLPPLTDWPVMVSLPPVLTPDWPDSRTYGINYNYSLNMNNRAPKGYKSPGEVGYVFYIKGQKGFFEADPGPQSGRKGWGLVNESFGRYIKIKPTYYWSGKKELDINANAWGSNKFLVFTIKIKY